MACNLIGMINNEDFKKYNLPYIQRICAKAKENNIKVIVDFLGNIKNKWDIILKCNADALAFEEFRKNSPDRNIDEIADKVKGRYVLFGNIDPISILEKGKLKDLKDQVRLQIKSGRKNNSRFVMSLGGPVTPNTEVKRVEEFIDIARQEIRKN
jgi:uroporphyrinogen-III decarboxylase